MTYNVVWKQIAESQATAWLKAADRSAVVAAAERIVSQLGVDPNGIGDS